MGPSEVGAAGTVLIFLSVLIGTALLSLIVFTYAAYSMLVILTHTAAGDDEFRWPGDPLADVFWIFWYFLWIVIVWAGPASMLLRSFELPLPWHMGCLVALSWLVFPISLLSSLSSSSRWVLLQPRIFPALLKQGTTLARFYLVTGCGLAISFLAFYSALTGPLFMLPVAAVYGGVSFFVYCRLLGRLGWLISWHAPTAPKLPKKDEPAEKAEELLDFWPEEKGRKTRPRRGQRQTKNETLNNSPQANKTTPKVEVTDPWAIPPELPPAEAPKKHELADNEMEDPLGPVKGTYSLEAEERSPPTPGKIGPYFSRQPLEPFALKPASPEPAPVPEAQEDFGEEHAARLERPAPSRPLPADPMATNVYAFPFYPLSLRPLIALIAGLFGVAGALRVLLLVWPRQLLE
jgi:hypothetical protein